MTNFMFVLKCTYCKYACSFPAAIIFSALLHNWHAKLAGTNTTESYSFLRHPVIYGETIKYPTEIKENNT